jgi:hypothetical protein
MPPKTGESAKVSAKSAAKGSGKSTGKSAKGSGKSAGAVAKSAAKGSGKSTGKSAGAAAKSAGAAAKSTGSASKGSAKSAKGAAAKGSGKSTGSASKSTGSASKGSGAASVYAKTARKDKDGRVVYRRAGSSADYVRRKDATGAIVYRKCASTRGGAPDEMIGGKNPFTGALNGLRGLGSRISGICRYGTDVNGACLIRPVNEHDNDTNHDTNHDTNDTNINDEGERLNTPKLIRRNKLEPMPDSIPGAFLRVEMMLMPLTVLFKMNENTKDQFIESVSINRKFFDEIIQEVIDRLSLLRAAVTRHTKDPFYKAPLPPVYRGGGSSSFAAYSLLEDITIKLSLFVENYDLNDPKTYTIEDIDGFIYKLEQVRNMTKNPEEMILDE